LSLSKSDTAKSLYSQDKRRKEPCQSALRTFLIKNNPFKFNNLKTTKNLKKLLKSQEIRPIRISGMLFPESGAAFPGASAPLKSLCFRAFKIFQSADFKRTYPTLAGYRRKRDRL
jgi:hypothetical protein